MTLYEILEKDGFLPTDVAVNLIINLDIIQNGYDLTVSLVDTIKRNTTKLHAMLQNEWINLLHVEGPSGGSHKIFLIDYLGVTFNRDDFNFSYRVSFVNFTDLLECYNQYLKLCNKPEIQFNAEVDAGGKALRAPQLAKFKCQAIAKTLWHLQQDLTIQQIIQHEAIKEYGDGKNYLGKHTLRGWVSEVDPRPKDKKTGPKANKTR